jgi:hypothetical protein
MVTFAIIGALAGALLGLRFRVWALIPASLVAIVAVIATGHGQHVLSTVLTALATIVSLQIAYTVGCAIRAKVPIYRAASNTVHFPSAHTEAH